MTDLIIGKGNLQGKGVYANRDFKKGDIVIRYNLKPLTIEEYERLPEPEKEFTHNHHGQIYLYLEPERFVNHSENSNTYQDFNEQCDIAFRNIKQGEMITTDATKDDVFGSSHSEDFNTLKQLEESLWRAETRFDRTYMEKILAPDFFEFGRSGRIYTREETLSGPAQEIKATLPLRNFAVHSIQPNVVLVTYVSDVEYDNVEIGNRSSLWIKTPAGWQLRFHQGTPTKNS